MSKPLIAVLVTYNRLDYLKTTIQKSLEFGFDEIVIVNNASTDETKSYLDSLKNKVTTLHLSENTGGAGGFYEGLKYVKENYNSGWALLYDDDSYPETQRSLVESELSNFDEEKTGCLSAAVYLKDGSISEMNRPGVNPFKDINTFSKTFLKGIGIKDEAYSQGVIEADICSFVGCFISVKTLKSTKVMPRKDFFIYADDALFTYELTEKGLKNYFVPSIRFIHDCKSFDKNSSFESLWKIYYLCRNNLVFYQRIAKLFFPLVFLRFLIIYLRRTRHYKGRKKQYLKTVFLGLKDWWNNDYSKSLDEVIKLT